MGCFAPRYLEWTKTCNLLLFFVVDLGCWVLFQLRRDSFLCFACIGFDFEFACPCPNLAVHFCFAPTHPLISHPPPVPGSPLAEVAEQAHAGVQTQAELQRGQSPNLPLGVQPHHAAGRAGEEGYRHSGGKPITPPPN